MRSFFVKLSPGPEDFLKTSATSSNFFRNPQLSTRSFFKILSSGAGLFFARAQGFVQSPTEIAMIIRGLGRLGGGGGADLF